MLALQPIVPPIGWPIILALFIVPEAWGLKREGRHDTLSETHWSQGTSEWSFRLWSTGSALAYGWGLARLPYWWLGIEPSIGWYFAVAGVVGWMVGHFWRIGRDRFRV